MRWRLPWDGCSTGPWALRSWDWLGGKLKGWNARTKERKPNSSDGFSIFTLHRSPNILMVFRTFYQDPFLNKRRWVMKKSMSVGPGSYGTDASEDAATLFRWGASLKVDSFIRICHSLFVLIFLELLHPCHLRIVSLFSSISLKALPTNFKYLFAHKVKLW